jgi:glycosyltransferase involved in cell wall biosynthesis
LNHPKISIITPSFNQGQYIEQTILSVLGQDYPNLEYIIIDGGSTDGSVDIIKKYEKHLKYWISEPDMGQTDAINKGFSHCTGEIFNWLNSDDFLEPGALHAIAKAYRTGATVIAGRIKHFIEGSDKTWFERTKVFSNVGKTIATSTSGQPGTFFSLKSIKAFFPLPVHLRYVMCQDLWIQYLLENGVHQFIAVDDLLVHFRRHAKSKTQEESSRYYFLFSKNFFIEYIVFFAVMAKGVEYLGEYINAAFKNEIASSNLIDSYVLRAKPKNRLLFFETTNYFLFNVLDEDFRKGRFANCKQLVSLIDPSVLDAEDCHRYKVIKSRLPFKVLIQLRRYLKRKRFFKKK